jgi:hypothetical protein
MEIEQKFVSQQAAAAAAGSELSASKREFGYLLNTVSTEELAEHAPQLRSLKDAEANSYSGDAEDPTQGQDGDGQGELHTSELHTSELRTSELHTSELRTSELRTSELRTSELRTSGESHISRTLLHPLI